MSAKRQVVLDTETTGLEVADGNRILEIGCVEMIDRKVTGRSFHQYINPERDSEEGALAVHGITSDFLADKPLFADIAQEFLTFVDGAELIIHNAGFDLGHLNNELQKIHGADFELRDRCDVLDTMIMARERHPGQRNNLDALCKRYDIDNSGRSLHGALLDALLLAEVYLAMTGGQVSLQLGGIAGAQQTLQSQPVDAAILVRLRVQCASEDELAEHRKQLEILRKKSGDNVLWDVLGV